MPEAGDPTVAFGDGERTLAESFHALIASQTDPELIRPDADKIGRYPVRGHLGAGGMGEVVAVHDADLGREVAAKVTRRGAVLDSTALHKFVLEARVTGQLEHPGIPPVHELGLTADGRAYFTMKKVGGADLAAILKRRKLSLPQLIEVFSKICDAVAFAHSRGVVHRDLKPANVMVGDFGEVLVMDWGLAKLVGHDDEAAASLALDLGSTASDETPGAPLKTLDGDVVGTPAYMSPEQANGKVDQLDERSDIYALGALLYHILTGRPPYEGSTVWSVLGQVTDGPPQPPSVRAPRRKIPHELESIVLKAMERSRSRRYGSVAQLRDDIRAAIEGRLVGAARYGLLERTLKWARRNRSLAAVLLTLALGGAATAGWVQLQQMRKAQAEASQLHALILKVEALGQAADLAGCQAAVDDLAQALRDKRVPPTPELREQMTRRILAVQTYADTLAQLQARPDCPDGIAGRRAAALLALVRMARMIDEYAIARAALETTAQLLPDHPRVAEERRALARDLRRRADRAREVVSQLLDGARDGGMASERAYQQAVLELCAQRDRAAAAALRQRLQHLTSRMQALEIALLRDALEPSDDERRIGGRRIEGLEPALARLSAWREQRSQQPFSADSCAPYPPADQDAIQAAGRRLLNRRRRSADSLRRADSAQVLIAHEMRRAQGDGDPRGRELSLLCDGLAQIGGGEADLRALRRYLLTDPDPVRSIHAGQALARLLRPHQLGELLPLRGRYRTERWWRGMRVVCADRLLASDALAEVSPPLRLAAVEVLAERGLVDRALRSLDEWLTASPGVAELLAVRGRIRAMRDGPAAGLPDLERAIALEPSARWIAWRANQLARAGRGAEALAEAAKAAELDPDDPEARSVYGALLWTVAREATAAERQLDAAVQLDPTHIGARERRIYYRFAQRQYQRAYDDCDDALLHSPDASRLLLVRADNHLDRGALKAAARDLSLVLEQSPKHRAALSRRCQVLRLSGLATQAMADAERLIALYPKEIVGYQRRGEVRLALRDHRGALSDLERTLTVAPDSLGALVSYATAARHLGRRQLARTALDKALARDPRHVNGRVELAELEIASGRFAQAQQLLGQLLRDSPQRRGTLLALSCRLHRRAGDLARAVEAGRAAVAAAPDDRVAALELGRTLTQARRLDEAEALLERACQRWPWDGSAKVQAAEVLAQRGQFEEARAALEAVLEIWPRFARAWATHAYALRRLGQPERAIQSARRSIELDRWQTRPYLTLILCLQDTKQPGIDQALAGLLKADPANSSALRIRARRRRDAGDLPGALADAGKAAAAHPEDYLNWWQLGDLQMRAARPADAVTSYEQAMRRVPPGRRESLGRALASAREQAKKNR